MAEGQHIQAMGLDRGKGEAVVTSLLAKGLVGKSHIAPRGEAHVLQCLQLSLPKPAWLLASGEVVLRKSQSS